MNETILPSHYKITDIDLVYRNEKSPQDRYRVDSAETAYKLFMSAWDMNKIELTTQFMIMLLDNASNCIGVSLMSTGGHPVFAVDPKLVFATALRGCAASIALASNHPSGDLEPSHDDFALTWKIREGGKILDIEIRDHLIISPYGYYSMSDEQLLTPHNDGKAIVRNISPSSPT
jgi:DNA repair protein RadC